jgi:hypothetical protein
MITSPTDDLDPRRCKSGQSSLQDDEVTEGTNTTSVLKAVMLMKRSRGSIQMDNKFDELESNTNSDQKNENKLHLSLKRGVKSAPNLKHRGSNYKVGRKQSIMGLEKNKQKHQSNKNGKSKFVNHRNKTSVKRTSPQPSSSNEKNRRSNTREPKTEPYKTPQSMDAGSDLTRTSSGTSSKKPKTPQLEVPTQGRPCSSPTPYAREQEKKHTSELDDRWVAGDKKFKVKQIVNTRIPGKENPVEVYQRFEPSMFSYVDTMNNFEREKAVDPFGAKLKARAWLKQAKEKLAAGGGDYNPGQSPIIVIEEFCAEEEVWNGKSQYQKKENAKGSQGSLEILLEDSDKENIAEQETKVE